MPRTRPPYPPEFREQIIELVRAGRTPEEICGRVRCVTPVAMPELLDELAVPQPTSVTVVGYKVSVQYGAPAPAETKTRLQGVRDIIARSLRRQSPP